ncbi:MAG: alpha/beta hydrolase [Chloroflexi bacterium]|nr:alpha/beta hydrolase [Chloroflexota bacterium]
MIGLVGLGLFLFIVVLNYTHWFSSRTSALNAGSQVIETEMGPIEYALVGDEGPVVLSLHGVPGGYDFGIGVANMLSLNESGFRVLSVSRPGYLRTPLNGLVSAESQADLYAALLDELAIDSVALLAVSGGGPSALALAQCHPERVWGMIMAITITRKWTLDDHAKSVVAFRRLPPILVNLSRWYIQQFALRLNPRRVVIQNVAVNTRVDPDALGSLADEIMADPERMAHLILSISFSAPMSTRWEGTLNDLDHQAELPNEPDYRAIRAPVFAVYGQQDALVPLEHVEYMVEHLPHVEIHIDPEGGHIPYFHHQWSFVQSRSVEFLWEHAPTVQD